MQSMQGNNSLILVLKILAVMKLCGSVLTWKEMKVNCEKENRRCSYKPSRRWWELPVLLRSSVCLVPPLPWAQQECVCLLRVGVLSWSNCSMMLSCAGVWEPSFTVLVKYHTRERLKPKACILCGVNRRAMVGLLVLNEDTDQIGNGGSWWKGR